MSDESERLWDDAVETAWREFRQRLADRTAGMAADDSIVVEMPQEHDGGASPYCQVAGGEHMVRVEAVSNVYLADECQLDDHQVLALGDMGFQQPEACSWEDGETNFWADLELREADRAAVMVVRALREVYGVLHPVYLDAGGLEPEGAVRPLPPKRREEVDLNEPMQQSSVEEVRALVDLAVADICDGTPEWDDDGYLGLWTEDHVVWVSVNGHAPRVLLSCMLLDEVDDTELALVEINKLNRAEWGLTFTLHERRITVTRELGLGVALPIAVQGEIQRLLDQVDGWGRDLGDSLKAASEAVAKRRPNSRFATAYAVMAELEREQRGSVSPAAMVRIYGNDTGLLLKAIRITEQRRREYRSKAREARDQGQRAKEKMVRARHDYLRDLAARMRAGLRLMVDAPVREVQVDQLALFDEDEAGSNR